MCNAIHTDKESRVRKIKSEGVGWKLFEQSRTTPGELLSLVRSNKYKSCTNDGWVQWWTHNVGAFCFFKTKKEAKTALVAWEKYARCAKE